jgi:hypothetical protein
MDISPIFIGGLDRSGKTTMRAFLHSHPNIAIPAVGSNMWTYFYNQYGDLRNPENFERCLSDMLSYKHVLHLDPDPERIRREFLQGPQNYARLFSLFLIHFADRENKPRWGVQTGLIERYADQIIEAYPGAKIIHMLRDPRDRYAGSLELWPNGRLRAGGSVSRWFYTTYLAKRNNEKYPKAYMVVRFEDLIRNPELTIRRVCDFLDEKYYSDMLEMVGAIEHRDKLMRKSNMYGKTPPLSEEYIGIFKEVVPKQERYFIQTFIGNLMKSYGYEPEKLDLKVGEKLRYLFLTLPQNLLTLIFWAGQEFLQQKIPQVFGRQPDSRRMVKSNIKVQEI